MADSMTLAELDDRLRAFPVAMLATISPQGAVHARPMLTQEREPTGDLWFVSALDTDKVAEIRQNPQVGVIYFRDSDNAYVSLSGTATVCDDHQLICGKWQESWRPWFPEGPDQQNLCMIQVKTQSVELWEPQGGNLGLRLEIARAHRSGDQARVNPPQRLTVTEFDDTPPRRTA
jgi:general stress protein 26